MQHDTKAAKGLDTIVKTTANWTSSDSQRRKSQGEVARVQLGTLAQLVINYLDYCTLNIEEVQDRKTG